MATSEQAVPRCCGHCSTTIDRKALFCQDCGWLTERTYKLKCANCKQDIICDQRLLEEPLECSLCGWFIDVNLYPKLLALRANSQRQREVYHREQRRKEREQRRQEKQRSRKERQAKRRAQAVAKQERQQQVQQQRTQQQESVQALRYAASHVQCKTCGMGAMVRQSVYRMSPVVVVIGYLLLVPPILGMAFFALFIALFIFGRNVGTPELGMGICGFVSSLISGLLGFLLVMKKKILRCNHCGATIAAS